MKRALAFLAAAFGLGVLGSLAVTVTLVALYDREPAEPDEPPARHTPRHPRSADL